MNLKPLNDRLIVQPAVKEEVTKNGIILPESMDKEAPEQGEVLAVGPGRLLDNGTRSTMTVKVGDRVMYAKSYSAQEISLNEKKCVVISESDVVAVIEN